MKRFVLVPGLCQLVNVTAALAQEGREAEDVLVLYGTYPGSAPGVRLEEAARQLWNWRQIVWAHDVLVAHFPTRKFAPVAREVLRERLGNPPDEIWVSKPGYEATKLALFAFPETPVVVYEDGAEEFIPWPDLCGLRRLRNLKPTRWPGWARREVSHYMGVSECLGMEGVCARDRARIARVYSFLARYFGPPTALSDRPLTLVEPDSVRSRLERLRALYAAVLPAQSCAKNGAERVLFLPQPFADLFLTPADEYAMYGAAVRKILEAGYEICWKDHPKEITPLGPRLQKEFGSERVEVLDVSPLVPVECVVAGWTFSAVVSVSSSSLLYLHALYGYPAYTAADCIAADRWLRWTDAELAKLFLRAVPNLDQLPGARSK